MTTSATDGEISSAIMEVALSLDDPATRQVFLERVFGDKGAAKEEMTRLLDAADGAATFFLEAREQRAKVTAKILSENHAAPPAATARFVDDDAVLDKLGPYRLIARLGEGGGGVVYEAEQEQPIRRRVAVKIVRVDLGNHTALARFDVERQALALMDHPNIAKVFDAGTTPSGRPYFAMELVTGEPIVRYCNERKLNCSERLELFVLVCNAIQHAHQKGIIHRDIKPSNILVTRQDGANVPKIIDFGIAKDAGAGESITAHDQFFGTPAYMSPEQVAMTGIDVDTRSDIFSLGVLLYELLTGATPIDRSAVPDVTFSQIRKSLLTWETERPSELLAKRPPGVLATLAQERGMETGDLLRFVRGDLDWIVMQALEKNRIRRYQTANGLATDVRRLLAHEPIAARPPSRVYVLAKFIRRNRIACGAALLLVILLVVGLATTAAMYERERKTAIEQLRLKNEAQAARNEADARSKISRAAFLLDQGRIDEADELCRKYPLSSIEPSLEAAAVFRALGDWNSENGRGDQAIQCYRLLREASKQDNPQKTLYGDDLMAVAAALLTENPGEYRDFREKVLERYTPADGRHRAEHLLKVCLIAPADPGVVAKLEREVKTMGDPRETPCPAWAAFSLSLYHLRGGNSVESLKACELGLASPERKSSCEASLEAVVALNHAAMGKMDLANAALQRARKIAEICNGRDFERGVPTPRLYWFDWAIAKLMIKEASARVGG
ncbi:serine/threonine-protein kinase [Haloferula sp. BvORR071]|uniref:serine/threonine protein kinase n=1 Tax=Haloferula sp. BvORR071 TaxID=1396141 RepID=UPI000695F565|nr:serine/threonine-protein kinase [Haloferula sp. BvORR071]